MSLIIKIGFNFIISVFLNSPIGLLDLFLCRIIICIADINIISIGNMKCNDKNRLIKIILILKFPQIIFTILFPIIGIDDKKFVITIIAQYDI